MANCPHHDHPSAAPLCGLQRLANHTITVTQARAPDVCTIVIVIDKDQPSHTALGSDAPMRAALEALELHTERLRQLLAGTWPAPELQ